ncbi:hypothetical protein DN748_06895 [Sinomicrobium soli]|nr:hypothetical protein DN748_06895 [Sinomicrobium sp. N-1-3-6]
MTRGPGFKPGVSQSKRKHTGVRPAEGRFLLFFKHISIKKCYKNAEPLAHFIFLSKFVSK